jgi:type IV pilus assembly protein PilE
MQVSGFHFIEILMTLAILSILIAFAIPHYNNYFVQSRRLEAASVLSQLALALEKYHIENNSYEHVSLEILKFQHFIVNNYYHLKINHASKTDYLISAKPLKDQFRKDKNCKTLFLNSKGERKISGNGKLQDCW